MYLFGLLRKYMDVNINMRDYPTLHLDTNSSKETTFLLHTFHH